MGSNILSSAPIRNASLVSLNRLGAHYVFPMACGASSGNAWLEGSAPAGAIVSCQLNYVGGGQSAKVNATANAVGA